MQFIRKDLVEIRYDYKAGKEGEVLCVTKKDIDSLPVTELILKETAKWIPSVHSWMCSNCRNQESYRRKYCPECGSNMENPDVLIQEMQSADVRPVVHGRWIPKDLTYGGDYYVCSVCERTVDVPTAMWVPLFRFCPYCGSDMEDDA